MTDIVQIQSIRSQTLAQLDELRADPKPTYWLDGQRVHWAGVRRIAAADDRLVRQEAGRVRAF